MDWKKQIMESGEASVAYNTSTVDVHAACDMSSRVPLLIFESRG